MRILRTGGSSFPVFWLCAEAVLKTKDVIFVYARKGKNIAKFALDSHNQPRLYLKYYAVPDPDDYFDDRIRRVMEEFAFRYTGMIPGRSRASDTDIATPMD
ncbi:MAG: hypothetical protein MZU97_12980 [Bacillus subtilis]|nr:hypothetical protein [Bacillus subtilis]